MKRIWICFVVMTAISLSCNNSDEVPTPEPEEKWRIVEMLHAYEGNSHDTTFFEYNDQGYATAIRNHDVRSSPQPNDTIHITWNGNKIQKVEKPHSVYSSYETFKYTGDKVTEVFEYGALTGRPAYFTGKDSAVYENGKMTALYSFSSTYLLQVIRLTWTGNNVTREEHYSIDQDGSEILSMKVENTYTDKPGRSNLMKGDVLFWVVDSVGFHGLSENAVATQVVTSYRNPSETLESTWTYNYRDDAMNRLIETSIEVQSNNGSNGSSVYKYTYIDVE